MGRILGRGFPPSTQFLPFTLDEESGLESHFGVAVVHGGGLTLLEVTHNRAGTCSVSGGGSLLVTRSTTRSKTALVNGGGSVAATGFGGGLAATNTVSGGGTVTAEGVKNARVSAWRYKLFGPLTYEEIFGDTPPKDYRPRG